MTSIIARTHNINTSGDALDLTAAPSRIEHTASDYNAEIDIWRGVGEAYRLIRERMRQGGQGWRPQ